MTHTREGTGHGAPMVRQHDDATAEIHWLLAGLGKRVLRPGGIELTREMLARVGLAGSDVLELAPGVGSTAAEILTHEPRSYIGIEKDPVAAEVVRSVVGDKGEVRVAGAEKTGLPHGSADVVVGEAILSIVDDATKETIVNEVARVLRPGGRYAIHELALTPNSIEEDAKTVIQRDLAASMKVGARPITVSDWMQLLAEHELVVDAVSTSPITLLERRRLVADEGFSGALRFVARLLTRRDARHRVRALRRTFRAHRRQLTAVAILAHKPGGGANPVAAKGRGCC